MAYNSYDSKAAGLRFKRTDARCTGVIHMEDNATVNVPAKALADYLYQRTAQSKVTGKKELLKFPPDGITTEDMPGLLSAIIADDKPAELEKIEAVQGKKDVYYYYADIMTRHYAELDALLEDKDILATIATVVRSDSKLYPRPTQYSKLMNVPFRFTMDEILGAVARMKFEEDYQDIGVVTATNGNSGLYSEKYISKRYAQALLQGIEVEEAENP